MYAGAFGAGLIGTLCTWLFAVFPHIVFTDDYLNALLCGFAIILIFPTLYYYWLLLSKDPGFVVLPDKGW